MHNNVFAYNINLIFKPINLIYNCTGVAVGCGWQAFVAYVNVGCYYVVGIPLGCLLGFKFDLGAKVYQLITLSFPFLTHTNPMPMWDDIAPLFLCPDTQYYYS